MLSKLHIFQLPKLAKYYLQLLQKNGSIYLNLIFAISMFQTREVNNRCSISFPEKLTGNEGIIHGGITCFVMDSISGIHAQLFSGKSGTALTKNLSVDFLVPIYPKNIYTVETSEIQGRIIVEYRHDNTVVARGNAEVVFK
jgi:acyl-coenzyme A thioesterase PaaI-like protein